MISKHVSLLNMVVISIMLCFTSLVYINYHYVLLKIEYLMRNNHLCNLYSHFHKSYNYAFIKENMDMFNVLPKIYTVNNKWGRDHRILSQEFIDDDDYQAMRGMIVINQRSNKNMGDVDVDMTHKTNEAMVKQNKRSQYLRGNIQNNEDVDRRNKHEELTFDNGSKITPGGDVGNSKQSTTKADDDFHFIIPNQLYPSDATNAQTNSLLRGSTSSAVNTGVTQPNTKYIPPKPPPPPELEELVFFHRSVVQPKHSMESFDRAFPFSDKEKEEYALKEHIDSSKFQDPVFITPVDIPRPPGLPKEIDD